MADWYVYQHDAAPLGPWSTERIVSSIFAGALSPQTIVAAPGGARWLRALDVPVIASLLGEQAAPLRRESGLLMGSPPEESSERSVMTVDESELEVVVAPDTERTPLHGSSHAVPMPESNSLLPVRLNERPRPT